MPQCAQLLVQAELCFQVLPAPAAPKPKAQDASGSLRAPLRAGQSSCEMLRILDVVPAGRRRVVGLERVLSTAPLSTLSVTRDPRPSTNM